MPLTAAPDRDLLLLPLGLGALGLIAEMFTGTDGIPWVVAGFATGHSLSGST